MAPAGPQVFADGRVTADGDDPGPGYHIAETFVPADAGSGGGGGGGGGGGNEGEGGMALGRADGWSVDPTASAARLVWRKEGDVNDGVVWDRIEDGPPPPAAEPAAEPAAAELAAAPAAAGGSAFPRVATIAGRWSSEQVARAGSASRDGSFGFEIMADGTVYQVSLSP